jgi:DNA-directed RNA polymerase II subunit RPB1
MSTQKRSLIKSVEFGLFGPDEIARMSVCKITEAAMYVQNLPAAFGVNDHRLGSVDRRLACGTCRRTVHDCPGHFGSIRLEFPIYHVGYIDHVQKILKCVCYYCSSLLLTDAACERLRRGTKDRKKRLGAAMALAKMRRTCQGCGGCSPSYTKHGLVIRADFSKVDFDDPDEAAYCARPFTSSDARIILQNVKDEDARLLGFSPERTRPELFILTSLVVSPPIVRPSVVISEGSKARGQDDLTTKLCDIVKANTSLKAVLSREGAAIATVGLSMAAQQAVADLTFHVATLMCNDIRGQRPSYQRSGLPSKSVTSRLKGKEGRIRGSLMGKRVDFSARSVISPDPEMDVDQVGIPERVAKILTIPNRVTDLNISSLRARVRLGHGRLDGAHSIVRHGVTVLLEYADLEREVSSLKVGEVVERYLHDGDIVLFNRQPSLHKGSFMAFRVRIMAHSTFRINLACTPSLNADCDGDEMNVHVPQDAESQTEARGIMSVPNQIVSPQSNKPCIGLVQDSLLGASLISKESTRLTRQQMVELRSVLKYAHCQIGEPGADGLYTGRHALQMLFPTCLNFENHKTTPPVLVKNGCLISGRMCKQSLGTSYGGLVHWLWLQYGPKVCADFLSDAQRLINRWLTWRGFSVRLSDCEPPHGVEHKISNLIRFAEEKVRRIESHQEILEHGPGLMEQACSSITNRTLTDIGKVVHASLDEETNALYQTVGAGSKGNLINVAQLIGAVGQQSLEGKRIDGARPGYAPIPSTEPGSVVRPKGFVKNSYFRGLDPAEFFYHSMAGREGLVDTAVKTATTGYLQRRLMKAMETLKVEYDGTVRNSRDNVVQFVYGADGFDASFIVRHELKYLTTPAPEGAFILKIESDLYLKLSSKVRRQRTRGWATIETVAYSPCCISQAFDAAEKVTSSGGSVGAEEAFKLADALCKDVCNTWWGCRSLLELHIRWELRTSRTMCMAHSQLFEACNCIRRQITRAYAAPGEMVGAIAAQSIGEPTSQSTLNTFHHAGVAAKNVTLGVPRIKELIDCTRNMKTPAMRLVVLPSFASGEGLSNLRASLMHLTLAGATKHVRAIHDPDFFSSTWGETDNYLCKRETALCSSAPEVFCPFVVRIELDPTPLIERGMGPSAVADAVCAHLTTGSVQILYSEDHMDLWILRIRALTCGTGLTPFATGSLEETSHLRSLTEELGAKACRDCFLGGIQGVSSTSDREDTLMADVSQEEDPHNFNQTITVVDTSGTNLRTALGLSELRGNLCMSNDVSDVLAVLGIEAATAVLYEELTHTLQFDGGYINGRHVGLLVDLMTSLGQLLPISRHGLNRMQDNGPLARCSFEETVDVLYDAAAFGEIDPAKGITECVMLGQRAAVGTGVCEVITPVLNSIPESVDDESEEEVIFTAVDADVEMVSTKIDAACAPIEMPFDRNGTSSCSAFLPAALGHSFLHASAHARPKRAYAPSSPRRAPCNASGKKRKYEPSSPRA